MPREKPKPKRRQLQQIADRYLSREIQAQCSLLASVPENVLDAELKRIFKSEIDPALAEQAINDFAKQWIAKQQLKTIQKGRRSELTRKEFNAVARCFGADIKANGIAIPAKKTGKRDLGGHATLISKSAKIPPD
jgi:hypothetical protein